jgi:hypothetical protein
MILHSNEQGGRIMTQMSFSNTSRGALLNEQWGQVRGALESMRKMCHISLDEESKELDDIIDYFVMKVEFDSPLAIEE